MIGAQEKLAVIILKSDAGCLQMRYLMIEDRPPRTCCPVILTVIIFNAFTSTSHFIADYENDLS